MENKKYVKVMFGSISGANGFNYKLNEVNEATKWHPDKKTPGEIGGFNFSVEDKILRYLVRGDTIYDVELPQDAEVVDFPNESCPHGILITNKIIIKNPREITDEVAMEIYKKTDLPEKSYFKCMAGCAIRGNIKTANQILKDKVTKDNIDFAISEVEDFIKPSHYWDKKIDKEKVNELMNLLQEVKRK